MNLKTVLGILAQTLDIAKLHFYYVGKSHLDLAYKWRFEQSIQKVILTFKKAVFHCEKFPNNFQFCFSAPQAYAWVKEYDPELYQKIQQFVQNGQIEIVGGLWVEPDGMMPSGEAIIRQRLYGMKFFQEEFGKVPTIESLPDSFGFNVGLPQLLKKSGVECFFSHKMTWNQVNVFPFTNFWWASPDGSQVLVSNFPGERNLLTEWNKWGPYRYYLKPGVQKEWKYESDFTDFFENLDKDSPITDIMIFDGKGDGGNGPTYQEVVEMLGMIHVANNHNIAAGWAKTTEYFASISQQGENLAIWADELYLEDHQGTFSVHPEVKRNNRHLETFIQTAERLATIINLIDKNFSYPIKSLSNCGKNWRCYNSMMYFLEVLFPKFMMMP